MDSQKKPPIAGAPQRKRKKAASDGGGAAAAAAAVSPPPAAKKPRMGGPKAKVTKADRTQEEAGEAAARDEAKGGAAGEAADEARASKLHTGVFSKDLPWLMYGYGDADKPLKETVDLVEEIAMQYITSTVHTAMRAAAARTAATASSAARKDELKLEDVLYAVRKDPRKVARIQELIRRQQDIENAKRLYKGDGNEDMPSEI